MKDVAPELIEALQKDFHSRFKRDIYLKRQQSKLEKGTASYKDAYEYATSVGNIRAKTFKNGISSAKLPDGTMYYNIASRLITETLEEDHDLVSAYATEVQRLCNRREGIGLAALEPDLDEDRIDGFIQRLSAGELYDDIAWILDEPVRVHALSVVDDTLKKNAEFQSRAGMRVKVRRSAVGGCCAWCLGIAGDYSYPGVPGDVFARHDNCRCTLEYGGERLSAYTSAAGRSNTFR